MNHRERVRTALNLEQPDRVPMDLGGSLASTIVSSAYPALRSELGLPAHDAPESLRWAALAQIEEDVRQELDLDIVHAPRAFGTLAVVQVPSEDRFVDEWSVQWHKPKKGHYYVERTPFAQEATPAAVARHDWPEPESLVSLDGLVEQVRRLRQDTDYAICLELRGRVMSIGQFLRGFQSWMMDLAGNHDFVEALLEKTTDLQTAVNQAILNELGSLVDIVYTADDLGGQGGPLISRDCYRNLLRPHFARIWGQARAKTSAFLMHHCCGSIRPFIGDFVDLGVQALNPIQVSAAQMVPAELKREFGHRLCLWGGVDTREVMPRGAEQDVRAEVRQRIGEMGPGGGYILAAVHNLQPEVPPANVVTLFRAGRQFGTYPLD